MPQNRWDKGADTVLNRLNQLRRQLKEGPGRFWGRATPVRVMAAGFALVILLGTALLCLPAATNSGKSAGVMTALFTATSATCVTGLVVEDTYLFWSPFGRWVILAMIQVGGLGFMTLAAGLSMLLRRRISLRERLLLGASLNMDSLSGMVRLAKRVLFGSLAFEGAGAVILAVRFARDYGFWGGLERGIFHAVSAFCNAGFDMLGDRGKFSSLGSYTGDFAVTMTLVALIVMGGLGFFVWGDLYGSKGEGPRRLQVHTRIVLWSTGLLLLGGTLFFLAAEYGNPATMGSQGFGSKVLSALFQSATTRTAGFAQLDQSALTGPSKAMTVGLMFIGGSPGSTAGGVKTVTLAVLLTAALSALRGSYQATVFGRRIPHKLVMDALSVFVFGIVFVSAGSFFLAIVDGVGLNAALFECVSAFGTSGLSLGLTPTLSAPSLLMLAGLMFLGRVGVITIGAAAMARSGGEAKIQYPEARVMIG